jgi:hypothetical protein
VGVDTSIKWVARFVVMASVFISLGAIRAGAAEGDVIVASGTLDDRFLASGLFHIGEFWMRVPSHTEFHRWLSQGIHRTVVIGIVTDATRSGDVKNVRLLSGTLIHQSAPNPTANMVDRVGRLPRGDLSMVHMLFLKDELTGTFSAITFETADAATALKFDAYDDAHINIVIEIK